jgi:hypothetical protein
MRKMIFCAALTLGLVACGDDPCEKYVDVLCECEDSETCEDAKTTYEGADSDLQDECSSSLDEEKEAADARCDAGDSGGEG